MMKTTLSSTIIKPQPTEVMKPYGGLASWVSYYFFSINFKGEHMLVYFISSLIIGAIVFKLGAYSIIISIAATASKVIAALLLVAALVLLYRKFRRKPQLSRLSSISDK